jgi:hypothetical protein
MNWLINLYWDIRFKIEDKISDWKWNRELNKEDSPFVGEYNDNDNEIVASWADEEVEVKPKKKKKVKKKSVKKAKKSL